MSYAFVKTFLRRHMRHPRVYAWARRALLVGQYAARIPDEPDFRAFRPLNDRGEGAPEGLIVDIGANGGQSAVAFAFLLPKFRILSFEPNPALWPELDFIGRVIGRRFSYRKLGLGAEAGAMTLYVPRIGGLPVTTRASLDRAAAEAHCRLLETEIGDALEIAETTVEIVTFDSLALRPDAIKIDVEGYEIEVLRGMTETLREARPILMLESNAEDEACMALLTGMGYRILHYDPVAGRLAEAPERRTRNWFAVPEAETARFAGS